MKMDIKKCARCKPTVLKEHRMAKQGWMAGSGTWQQLQCSVCGGHWGRWKKGSHVEGRGAGNA